MNSGTLPLLYAGAMLVDAAAALVFGHMYDKKGVRALVWSTLLSAPFALFVFAFDSIPALLLGIALWGVGMGAQESILKAAVSSMVLILITAFYSRHFIRFLQRCQGKRAKQKEPDACS